MSLGDCDCWSNVDIVLLNRVLEQPWSKMSPRVHCDNLLAVSPLRKGANVGGRLGVGEVGSVIAIQLLAGNRKRIVNRIRTTMG
jgi:hypothetical protein